MKEQISFNIRLLCKKLRDMKLRAKIRIFLFTITIFTVTGIGLYSYGIAKEELIQNSKDAVLNLDKQGGRNLDDRIDTFRDTSYRLLQSVNIEKLLNYSKEEAARYRIANEGLPAAISQQSSLSRYTKYALLRPISGMVYDYYRSGIPKMSEEEQRFLLNELDVMVDKNHIVCWTVYKGEVYFVRQIVSVDFEEKGLLVFALDSSFFEFISDENEYIKKDMTFVMNKNDELLKCEDTKMAELIFSDIEERNAQDFYVYNYTREMLDDVYTITVIQTQNNGWRIVSYFSHAALLKGLNRIYSAMVRTLMIVILAVLGITEFISRTITKNIGLIEDGMKQYEIGHFEHRVSPASYDEIGLLGLQLNYMAVKISELIKLVQLKEEEKKILEVETLQAQINPHFLYNTLGSLKWAAVRNRQEEIAKSLDALVKLLRFTIKKAGGMVHVSEEVAYIENYIEIEKMRFGDRFCIQYEIEENMKEEQVPGFILQPLVENCLLHGLDPAKEDNTIMIRGYRDEAYLWIEVADNGEGMTENQIKELLLPHKEKKKKGFNSIGVEIVDKRLHELYGEDYCTEIRSRLGKGTSIMLRIPRGTSNEMENIDSGR